MDREDWIGCDRDGGGSQSDCVKGEGWLELDVLQHLVILECIYVDMTDHIAVK